MTSPIATVVVGGIIGGGAVTGAAQLVTALTGRGKATAERDSVVVGAAETVVGILRRELEGARADVALALQRASRCEEQAQELAAELAAVKRENRDLHERLARVERRGSPGET